MGGVEGGGVACCWYSGAVAVPDTAAIFIHWGFFFFNLFKPRKQGQCACALLGHTVHDVQEQKI